MSRTSDGAPTMEAASLARHLGGWRGRTSPGHPAYHALAAGIRMLVLDGRITLGTALPSERSLAKTLGLSRTTVTSAYRRLRDDGFLESQQGSRSVVTTPTARPAPLMPFGRRISHAADSDDIIDLRYAALPAPGTALVQAYRDALEALPEHLPTIGHSPIGLLETRTAIAERYTARGLPTGADEILVTNGAQHALGLVLALLVGPGDRVVVDHPTFPHALDAIRLAGGRPLPVALHSDRGGRMTWDLEALEAVVRQGAPRLGYLIADFHNPTGACLDQDGRRQLAGIARATRTPLVIDETMVDTWIDGPPPPPVAAFAGTPAARRELITIGSTSKSFWGGMRVGWIRADPSIIRRIASLRYGIDTGTPIVEQLATVSVLGSVDTILDGVRGTLRARRDSLLAAVHEHLPRWTCNVPAGGLSVWAELPDPASTAVAAAARGLGVIVPAGPRFGADGSFERYLRLPYVLPGDRLHEAARRLALVYREVSDSPGGSAADLLL